jgi:phosphoglycolate phosphatase-like HAD superfamily hydrolase
MVDEFKLRYFDAISRESFKLDAQLHHLLTRLKNQGKFISCLSASPHNELITHVNQMNMNSYFDFVSGGPPDKTFRFKELLKKRDIYNKDTIYIGDSKSDFLMSKELNISFVACAIYKPIHDDWMAGLDVISKWNDLGLV